ncbi:MAG: secretin N-terminal domain-containing protein [Vampirovibrionales bacterium]
MLGFLGGALPPVQAFSVQANQSDLAFLLKQVGQQAGINLILSEKVTGSITANLTNVPPMDALHTLATMGHLAVIPQANNIYMVLPYSDAQALGLLQGQGLWYAVKHGQATYLAEMLNQSLGLSGVTAGSGSAGGTATPSAFTPTSSTAAATAGNAGAGGGAVQAVRVVADAATNSLFIVGSPSQQQYLKQVLAHIDVPLEQRVYRLSYASPLEVMQKLQALLGLNQPVAGAGGVGALGGMMTVPALQETLVEGSGINNIGGAGTGSSSGTTGSSGGSTGSGGSSAGGGGAVGSLPTAITARSYQAATVQVPIPTQGVRLIPDTRLGQLTVMATPSQFKMIERHLPWLDAKPAQVAIEASVIEVSIGDLKTLGVNYQYNEGGRWQFLNYNFNTQSPLPLRTYGSGYSSQPSLSDTLRVQLNMLVRAGKAKSIANPTVVATHNTETILSILDDILRGQTFTQGNGQFFGQSSPVIGQAGIVLDILPKVGADNTVTLRIRPSITSTGQSVSSGGSTVQLVTSRDLIAQSVQVTDNESLLIGGLVDHRQTRSEDKLPILGDLPVLGALFRTSSHQMSKTELVILITPHILNPLRPTPVHRVDAGGVRPRKETPNARSVKS